MRPAGPCAQTVSQPVSQLELSAEQGARHFLLCLTPASGKLSPRCVQCSVATVGNTVGCSVAC